VHNSFLYRDAVGLCPNQQCDKIVDLASKLPDNARVLEIGSWLGKSTIAWLSGLHQNAVLDVLDLFDQESSMVKKVINDNSLQVFTDILNMLDDGKGQFDIWKYYVNNHPNNQIIRNTWCMDSEKYIKNNMGNDYDCVFLDADHSYKHVSQQLEYFKDVDVICGDDYHKTVWPETVRAVNEFLDKNNRELTVYENVSFYILRKA